ncbi:Tim44/TimA family putative adaptor protein [Celeribacter sp.]|uniref:Tim44/TimA family putative adaptor protein n=1 Tax=Celeribacter sp. TaxID=1890673 RepID=UPI003A912A77
MNQSILSLLVLAGIAIFLILRLRNVLGTRDGFEKPRVDAPDQAATSARRSFEVIEGGVDHDIADNVTEGSRAADELAKMKRVEPSFSVTEFLNGARGAYEMILMAFENDDLDSIRDFLADDVYDAFDSVVQQRRENGLTVHAQFYGVREIQIIDAEFDEATQEGEIKLRFVAEIVSAVANEAGEIVEGDATEIKRQKDIWSFARKMGQNDPNWRLVATGA